ncbi:CTD kinase subunit gamma CTK3-domain-containing protein [Lipomyces chichibuensis]|uniref:CTD kinase subunit gamma CTK3-domain-containing protein n=1 Tax=Lipomyces chichibuensis TaxID=1546026 RepID=UPI003343699C
MPLDAFEARLTFIELLRRLNASVQSATKCAQFALRYQDLSEDLYSCILEELDKTSLNARINILYFLETLCENSIRTGYEEYVDMVTRDLWEILDKVVPPAQGALANVALARKALDNLKQKSIITSENYESVVAMLSERGKLVSQEEFQMQKELPSFSKEEILRRMEEDRERHKRMRENIWVIPPGDAMQIEFENAWETTSSLDDDDYELMREETAILEQASR